MADATARKNLADAVTRRRAVLGYSMSNLPHGPGEVTLRSIEHARDETYRRKTLVRLDRSLEWKVGTSGGILDGTQEPPIDPDQGPHALRSSLLDAGVGGRHSCRELARRSGGRVPAQDWALLVASIPAGHVGLRWDDETLEVVADTLHRLGEQVTADQLQRAKLADLGYIVTTSDDDLGEHVAKLRAMGEPDLRRLRHLLQEVDQLLSPEAETRADRSRSSGI